MQRSHMRRIAAQRQTRNRGRLCAARLANKGQPSRATVCIMHGGKRPTSVKDHSHFSSLAALTDHRKLTHATPTDYREGATDH
eukprot:1161875-Pelagomonas_calceolata.AAC.2